MWHSRLEFVLPIRCVKAVPIVTIMRDWTNCHRSAEVVPRLVARMCGAMLLPLSRRKIRKFGGCQAIDHVLKT
jgi:hypothetical protein